MSIKKLDLNNENDVVGNGSMEYFLRAVALFGVNAAAEAIAYLFTGSDVLSSAINSLVEQFSPQFFGGSLTELLNRGERELMQNENGAAWFLGGEELANGEVGYSDNYYKN